MSLGRGKGRAIKTRKLKMTNNSVSLSQINCPPLFALLLSLLAAMLVTPVSTSFARENTSVGLADATVLIIRHAEKPDSGTGLAPAGEVRAQAYIGYFQHLRLNGVVFRPDTLTADSKNSESGRNLGVRRREKADHPAVVHRAQLLSSGARSARPVVTIAFVDVCSCAC